MKRLLFPLLIASIVFSSERKIDSSLDVRVPLVNYTKPENSKGRAGTVVFSKFAMDREDLVLRVDNKDKIFDTSILVRPNFVGFRSKLLNLGFILPEESAFDDLLEGLIEEGRVRFDSQKVQVTADNLVIRQPTTNVQLKNMRLFCKKHPKYPELDMPGFLGACLNDAQLNGQNQGSFTDASIEFVNTTEEGQIELHSLIERLNLASDHIHLKGQRTKLSVNETFKVQLEQVDFRCAKDEDLVEFAAEDFQRKCVNNLSIDVGTILVEDEETKNVTYLEPENVQIQNRRVSLQVPTVQMHGPEASTVIRDLELDCYRSPKRLEFAIGDVVDDCLSDGYINIGSVHSAVSQRRLSDEELFDNIVENGVRADDDDLEKSVATDISLGLQNNIVELNARTKQFGLKIEVFAKAKARLFDEKRKIELDLEEVKLPWFLGGRKKWLLMLILKRFVTIDMLKVVNDNIIVTLTEEKEEK